MLWRNKYVELAVVICLSAVAFACYQAIPVFPDPDSFYHARLAAMMVEQGLVWQFPWLPFTTLGQSFADHHLLYHIFLMPFVVGQNPIIGVKVAQVVLATILTVTCYLVLKRWHVPYAAPALVLLYSAYPMLVRVNLVKASAVAIILFVILLVTLIERRYATAGVITVVYSMTHGGFFLAALLAVVVWCAEWVVRSVQQQRITWPKPTGIVTVGLGMVIGVLLNPYFPANISFLWAQFFQIGVVNYSDTIEVGAEWYPFALPDLVSVLSILLVLAVGMITIVVTQYHRVLRDVRVVSLLLLLPPLVLLTLRSRRFIEYLVPVLWLGLCLVVLPAWQQGVLQRWWATLTRRLGRWAQALKVYLLLAASFAVVYPFYSVVQNFRSQEPLDRLTAATNYLQNQVPAGAVIFHGKWDDFPELFYGDPSHAYIVGLDPTFLYLADQTQYQHWADVSNGTAKTNSAADIRQYFQSNYVIIDTQDDRTKLLLAYLLRDRTVQTVFNQDHVVIFKL
ncbi:MAG: hypothetical protein HY565_02345 [Candidatus Kerfeldbacteria bacterium]|nr:hypothetical protein [Candidatus Kerfeldbacteria bacterium]